MLISVNNRPFILKHNHNVALPTSAYFYVTNVISCPVHYQPVFLGFLITTTSSISTVVSDNSRFVTALRLLSFPLSAAPDMNISNIEETKCGVGASSPRHNVGHVLFIGYADSSLQILDLADWETLINSVTQVTLLLLL